jgi:hypothetical protein
LSYAKRAVFFFCSVRKLNHTNTNKIYQSSRLFSSLLDNDGFYLFFLKGFRENKYHWWIQLLRDCVHFYSTLSLATVQHYEIFSNR